MTAIRLAVAENNERLRKEYEEKMNSQNKEVDFEAFREW
jgi:hypothetical protein